MSIHFETTEIEPIAHSLFAFYSRLSAIMVYEFNYTKAACVGNLINKGW